MQIEFSRNQWGVKFKDLTMHEFRLVMHTLRVEVILLISLNVILFHHLLPC